MRYVLVCLIKGEALNFHETLVSKICSNFNVKRQRLPAHFTIKAPFETERIKEVENILEEFSRKHSKNELKIKDFNHFRDAVVYMDIHPSKDALQTHDDFIDSLKTLTWLDWKHNEGKGKVLHCTLVSKLPHWKFKDIWDFVNQHDCDFNAYFDNISILRWDKDRWVTYKEYKLK